MLRATAGKFNVDYFAGGEDFEQLPNGYNEVIFPAGITSVYFSMKTINDYCFEATETFRVKISVPYGIVLGNNESAVVNILDDDCKYLYS